MQPTCSDVCSYIRRIRSALCLLSVDPHAPLHVPLNMNPFFSCAQKKRFAQDLQKKKHDDLNWRKIVRKFAEFSTEFVPPVGAIPRLFSLSCIVFPSCSPYATIHVVRCTAIVSESKEHVCFHFVDGGLG